MKKMKKPQPQSFCKNNNPQSSIANNCNIQTCFIACICFCFGFLSPSDAYAQESNSLANSSFKLKREDLSWGNRLNDKSTNEMSSAYISSRISKNFTKAFKNADNIKWYVVDKFFLAAFNNNGRNSRVLFNKTGGILYEISYGVEKDLPIEVKNIIKTIYSNYNITSIAEVSEEWDRKEWIINLANSEKIKKVCFHRGDVFELENYNRDNGHL